MWRDQILTIPTCLICVEVLANTTLATILQYVNVSDHMYILNLTQYYMPNILQLKTLPILLSILCAFYSMCFLFLLSVCFFSLSSCLLSGYFSLFHFHPSLTLEIKARGYEIWDIYHIYMIWEYEGYENISHVYNVSNTQY